MTPRLLPAAARTPKPWKNGGGETFNVVVSPEGAGLDTFDWRVSMARVASDGPFSAFEGIDRSTAILTGDGLTLELEGLAPLTVRRDGPAARYPGDVPTYGRLTGAPVLDLNVMSRRGRIAHDLQRRVVDAPVSLPLGPAVVIAAAEARLRLLVGGQALALGPLDAALCEAPAVWTLEADTAAAVWIATFRPA